MLPGPGVTVVALEPSVGPVPPPMSVVDAVGQRRVRLLRRNHVDMRVHTGRRQDEMVARDRIGRETEREPRRDSVHRLRVAGFADRADAAVADADVGFHDPLDGVDDGHVRNDEIGRPFAIGQPVVHPHAFAQALAAAEDDLVAGRAAQVALDLDEETGVAEANAIAGRGAVESDVFVAGKRCHGGMPRASSADRARGCVTTSSGTLASRPARPPSPCAPRPPCPSWARRPDC